MASEEKDIQNMEEFDKELNAAGEKLVVVDFWAVWCGPCRQIGPKLKKIGEADPEIVVLKVNVDEVTDVAEKYGIKAMPTFIFFKKSKKLGEMVGANENKLKEEITKHKATPC